MRAGACNELGEGVLRYEGMRPPQVQRRRPEGIGYCGERVPPPFVLTRACPNRAIPCFRTFRPFWNHCFCGPNPIETVACSFVQAAGRVNMGGKVLVYL